MNGAPYEPVIGLEVHVRLATRTKLFCGCSNRFGAEPNSQVCPVCLGLPGALPVLNRKAVEYAVRLGIALHGRVNQTSWFARKHYFYPDLPKGYQITQYEAPLGEDGWLEIRGGESQRRIRIRRIHLEEDAGRSIHAESYVGPDESLIDANRCGTPLVEIVTEPDLHTPAEAFDYLTRLRRLVRWLGVGEGNMEEGGLRCDANVSLRPKESQTVGVKTELKNMNSFRGVEKALAREIARQEAILKKGGRIVQETLLWDETASEVRPMRCKEEAHDYRYFPDPDLPSLVVDEAFLETIRTSLPELPEAREKRWRELYSLTEEMITLLNADKPVSDYTDALLGLSPDPKKAAHWVMGEVLRAIHEREDSFSDFPLRPEGLVEILTLVSEGTLSHSAAKQVFDTAIKTGDPPRVVMERLGLSQVSDEGTLFSLADRVISQHPEAIRKYRSGKRGVLEYLVGCVMRASGGKAHPGLAAEALKRRLETGSPDP